MQANDAQTLVLCALADGPLHGYAVNAAIEQLVGERLGAGSGSARIGLDAHHERSRACTTSTPATGSSPTLRSSGPTPARTPVRRRTSARVGADQRQKSTVPVSRE
ncbi:PadR family transcriptional regulator [Streptacidiphilus pinicola]|uniref:PadR family transcriptional regulator n=1 Tax=Streptacidiphilus pinicola TaxID=2219663 RepID=A0A2X0IL49_9ACTN|nr:PadR family transcriptional regulator [Streptacidiphilus pinicola]